MDDPQRGGLGATIIAFRFGVEQEENLRACDDLRRSSTNLARRVDTPILLISRGPISQIAQLLDNMVDEWGLFKDGHVAAYKQPILDLHDRDTSIIALRNPYDKLWYGYASRALVFGSIADVVRYNAVSRLITDLSNRLFGIPIVSFFGDFAEITNRLLSDSALANLAEFCSILGIKMGGNPMRVRKFPFLDYARNSPPSQTISTFLPAWAIRDGRRGYP